MSYSAKRKLLSQNFLFNRQFVRQLIRFSSIDKKDTVIEVGTGEGIITRELARNANNVTSYEIDASLYKKLSNKLIDSNIKLVCGDFLQSNLPNRRYKVFSNVPFSNTADIIRKLLLSYNGPEEAWLIVQKEAAKKFVANNDRNSMAAILYYPWWEINIIKELNRSNFKPQPKATPVLLRIKKRQPSLLSQKKKDNYQDFVAYSFNKVKKCSKINPDIWLHKFNTSNILSTRGSFTKLLSEQSKLKKIHRTRLSNNWRSSMSPANK